MDRGYHSFELVTLISSNRNFFLIRMKHNDFFKLLGSNKPENQEEYDITINRTLTSTSGATLKRRMEKMKPEEDRRHLSCRQSEDIRL